MKWFMLVFAFITINLQAQVSGCTDPKAKNYNHKVSLNDGSCLYEKTTLSLKQSITLDGQLVETSGLICWNNRLWTHNDDTDTHLYALDTISGNILETYNLPNVVNNDWEEISQDDNHLYLGDFGNNAHGNRKNLNILKIEKKSLLANTPIIERINFKYQDQNNFEKKKSNNTDFDCEAFIVSNDSIYLFTKEWKSKKTTIYTLPKQSGDYIASRKASFDVQGLITGVTYIATQNKLVFCGYTSNGQPFLYLFYDFKEHQFFSGNKRKIILRPKFQQIEGISSSDGFHYYLTNEHLKFLTIDDPQKLQLINLTTFFKI
jgi:hypothetical protein